MYLYAGAYLELSRISLMERLCKNHKKAFRCSTGFEIRLWYRFYSRKGLQNVTIYLILSKSTSKVDFFDGSNIYVQLFNLRHVIHIPSFRIVNLLCCGDHFSNITFTDAKTKCRSHYHLNHIRTSLGRPRYVSE